MLGRAGLLYSGEKFAACCTADFRTISRTIPDQARRSSFPGWNRGIYSWGDDNPSCFIPISGYSPPDRCLTFYRLSAKVFSFLSKNGRSPPVENALVLYHYNCQICNCQFFSCFRIISSPTGNHAPEVSPHPATTTRRPSDYGTFLLPKSAQHVPDHEN